MASTAASSQSNRESLGCAGMGHGCAAKKLQQLHNTIMSVWTTMIIKQQIGVADANKNCKFTNIVHRVWILLKYYDILWPWLIGELFFARGRHTAVRECSSGLCKQSELSLLFSDFPLFFLFLSFRLDRSPPPSPSFFPQALLFFCHYLQGCELMLLFWKIIFILFSIIITNKAYTTH